MTSFAVCPCCDWPVRLSLGRCAICGISLDAGSRAREMAAPKSVDPAAWLVERWLIHASVIAMLVAGRQVLSAWLCSLQLVATVAYLVIVALWSLKSARVPMLKRQATALTRESGVFAGLALAVLIGFSSIRQNTSSAGMAAGSQSDGAEDPQLVRLRQQGLQTQAYLRQFQQLILGFSQPNLPAEKLLELLSSIADRLETLPTAGVDEQAVAHVFDVARVLRMLLAYVQKTQDPGSYIEAFLRGLSGDPFGSAVEFSQFGQSLSDEIQRVDSNERRLKAILAARYNMPFE